MKDATSFTVRESVNTGKLPFKGDFQKEIQDMKISEFNITLKSL